MFALAVAYAVYTLIPSFLGLRERTADLKSKGQDIPWYYSVLPSEELNLGLDLRGGLYMEMEVGVDEALKHQVETLASDIRRYVLEDDFKGAAIKYIPGYKLRVTLGDNDNQKFRTKLAESGFGRSAVDVDAAMHEVFYTVKTEPEKARHDAITALAAIKGFAGLVDLTHGDKFLAVSYGDNEKDQVLTALQAVETAGTIVKVEAPADVLYLSLNADYFNQLKTTVLEQAANAARNRIDRFGVNEASVSKQGTNRLVVELPGVKDPEQIIDIVKRTGKLEFRLVSEALTEAQVQSLVKKVQDELKLAKVYEGTSVKKINEALKADLPKDTEIAFGLMRDQATNEIKGSNPYLLETKVDVTGDMLENASVQSENSMPVVSMVFNKVGAKKFGDLTGANVGRNLAIVLDGIVTTAPNIRGAIPTGQAQIELGFGNYQDLHREASQIVLVLKEGALPASLTIATKNIIGPSLGEESINAGLKSLLIAAGAVVIFMLVYYKVGGLIANVALIVNVLMIFAVMALFQASLTLPGIAGIVLTLGMAVDANVIIFERMREELFHGGKPEHVVEESYSNAMSAIIDSNVTTFISGVVLFQFGTGPIKGFATTLMIGIVTSMITAILLTRLMYDCLVSYGHVKTIKI